MPSVEHYKVSYAVRGSGGSVPVRVVLVNGLRLTYFFTKEVLKVGHFLHEVVRGEGLRSLVRGTGGRGGGFESHARMLARVGKERGDLRGLRSHVVSGELYHREHAIPVGLEIVHVGSEVLLDHRVHDFGLAIGFGVESNRQTGVDLQLFR